MVLEKHISQILFKASLILGGQGINYIKKRDLKNCNKIICHKCCEELDILLCLIQRYKGRLKYLKFEEQRHRVQ